MVILLLGKKGRCASLHQLSLPSSRPIRSPAAATEAVWPIDGDPVKRASKDPEPVVDITAMRELANRSAGQALATHQQRHQTYATLSKLVYGGIAMSVALLMILHADHYGDPAFLGGCLAAMGGFYWAIQLCVTLLQTIRADSEVEACVEKVVVDSQN